MEYVPPPDRLRASNHASHLSLGTPPRLVNFLGTFVKLSQRNLLVLLICTHRVSVPKAAKISNICVLNAKGPTFPTISKSYHCIFVKSQCLVKKIKPMEKVYLLTQSQRDMFVTFRNITLEGGNVFLPQDGCNDL